MHVTAISTPASPDWRWRLLTSAGEVVEESRGAFPSIAAAITAGTARLRELNVVDHSVARPLFRGTSYLRGRK